MDDGCSPSSWDALAPELQLETLSWLPAIAVLRCRSVCKSWNTLTRDPAFVETQRARADQAWNRRSFLFHCKGRIEYEDSVIKIAGDNSNNNNPLQLSSHMLSVRPDLSIAGLCNGLLCLSNGRRTTTSEPANYLCNPITHECLKLPPIPSITNSIGGSSPAVLGFGFEPRRKEYKVLAQTWRCRQHRGHHAFSVAVCTVPVDGDPQPWRYIPTEPYWIGKQGWSPVVDGKLHWLATIPDGTEEANQAILSFDLHEETVSKTSTHTAVRDPVVRLSYLDLTELQGCLALVKHWRGIKVWTMTENGNHESWVCKFSFYYGPRLPSSLYSRAPFFCRLEDQKLLICHREGIISYDPKTNVCRRSRFEYIPPGVGFKQPFFVRCDAAVPFAGSLVSLKGAMRGWEA